jgi:hypothetical protein
MARFATTPSTAARWGQPVAGELGIARLGHELKARVLTKQEFLESAPAPVERIVSNVLPRDLQDVERDQDRWPTRCGRSGPSSRNRESSLQCAEVGMALLVGADELAVDDCSPREASPGPSSRSAEHPRRFGQCPAHPAPQLLQQASS